LLGWYVRFTTAASSSRNAGERKSAAIKHAEVTLSTSRRGTQRPRNFAAVRVRYAPQGARGSRPGSLSTNDRAAPRRKRRAPLFRDLLLQSEIVGPQTIPPRAEVDLALIRPLRESPLIVFRTLC
jgi:hypothetical protein